jgi:hypothetical protein
MGTLEKRQTKVLLHDRNYKHERKLTKRTGPDGILNQLVTKQ